ncbi:MAG: hypothetical protein ACEQSA_04430 [Weeksellaceae bacterium]
MNNISAVIVVKGYPIHLAETLDSLHTWVAEIVLVDIGMSPLLEKVLINYKNLRIEKIDKEVLYVEQIREETKAFAKHPYVLFMDPDEVIPATLATYIQSNYEKYDYLIFPRKNIIFGKWIEHARWWPDYQIRFFKKTAVHWKDELHAQPKATGNGHKLDADPALAIMHYNYDSVAEYFAKAVRYAKSEQTTHELSLPHTVDQGISEFMSRFFLEKGYKDNVHGFYLSFFQMMYPFLVYFSEYQRKGSHDIDQTELIQAVEQLFAKGHAETMHWMLEHDLYPQNKRAKKKVLKKLISVLQEK